MTSHPSHQPVSALRARMIEDMSVRGFHLGARLIQTARRTRIKDSPKLRLRFYCCVRTTTSSVFTQPGPLTDLDNLRDEMAADLSDNVPIAGALRITTRRRLWRPNGA